MDWEGFERYRLLTTVEICDLQNGNVWIGVFPEGEKALTAESPCV